MTDYKQTVEKLSSILGSEEMMMRISNSASIEEMQECFAENGIVLTTEEVNAFVDFMNSTEKDALSAEDLDLVAGGVVATVTAVQIFSWAWAGTAKIAKWCWDAGKWVARNIG